jgi:Spy/CpxP family protein refolding chaperone
MKSKAMTIALLAGSLAMSPVALSAQPSDSAKAKHMEKMFADLNLTQDQKTKLKALHEQQKDQHKQVFDQMKALREKTKAELLKPQPSKQVLDGYAAQFGDLHKQLAQKRTEHLLQVKAILTPEQFTKLLSHEPKGPGFGKGDRKGGPRGPGGPDDDM